MHGDHGEPPLHGDHGEPTLHGDLGKTTPCMETMESLPPMCADI